MKPRLLDLFCGAGGCTKGYQRAGFYVVGVDIEPQPNYCGDEFVQADAMTFPLEGFDAIHASPPCQAYSRALRHLAAPKPMLLDAVRERLRGQLVWWVVENVPGAPMPQQADLDGREGVMLCGSSLGLRVYRHRLFESSFPIVAPSCSHPTAWAMNPHNQAGRDRIYAEFGRGDPEVVWRREMGVPWMNKHEGREAIPPAYTELIGHQLIAQLSTELAA